MARVFAMAAMVALSTIGLQLPAQAESTELAPQADLAQCNDGYDEYTFSPGLDLTPTPGTKFSGKSLAPSTCAVAPSGATEVLVKSANGEGTLACTINAAVTGDLLLHWLRDNAVVDTSKVKLLSLAIDGATKEVLIKGQIESGAAAGGLLTISYTSLSDTRKCAEPDGLKVVDGVVKTLTVV